MRGALNKLMWNQSAAPNYILTTLAIVILATGCQSKTAASPDTRIEVQASVSSDDSRSEIRAQNNSNPQEPRVEIDPGTGEYFDETASVSEATNSRQHSDGRDFIFRNTPLDVIVNQVLGEGFGLNYTIGPNATGTLSIRLEGIQNATQAISALDAALNLQNIEIRKVAQTYFVQRIGNRTTEEVGEARFFAPEDPISIGATTAILSVRYANTENIVSLVSNIVPTALVKADDDERGLIVISGSPDQVYQAAQTIRSLDIDYLSAISTGFIELQHASAEQINTEMTPIIERIGGVSLIAVERLNSIMIVARNEEALMTAREWIARLDRTAGPKLLDDLLIYKANHANALDLVALAEGTPSFSFPQAGGDFGSNSASSEPARLGPTTINQTSGGGLYSALSIRVDEGQNAIIARGPAADLASLLELLKTLDQPKRQVLIEATIVEVTLSDSTTLGVEWDAIEDQISATLSNNASGAVTSLFPGLSVSYINTDVSAVVNALASTTDVEVISSPRMMVLNNETARLQIGDQVPVITQSAVSITDPGAPIVNSTTYRDTGVILTVTPRIRSGGMVELEVAQEVSGVAEEANSNPDSPTITQRSVESVLAIPTGSTAVLGGLMSSTRSQTSRGVPVLKEVPVLGYLFRTSGWSERRTELVILIEPTVVQADQPFVALPERLRLALERAKNGDW